MPRTPFSVLSGFGPAVLCDVNLLTTFPVTLHSYRKTSRSIRFNLELLNIILTVQGLVLKVLKLTTEEQRTQGQETLLMNLETHQHHKKTMGTKRHRLIQYRSFVHCFLLSSEAVI